MATNQATLKSLLILIDNGKLDLDRIIDPEYKAEVIKLRPNLVPEEPKK